MKRNEKAACYTTKVKKNINRKVKKNDRRRLL